MSPLTRDTGHSLLSVNDSSGVVTVNIVMIKIDGKQNTIHSNFLHEVHLQLQTPAALLGRQMHKE